MGGVRDDGIYGSGCVVMIGSVGMFCCMMVLFLSGAALDVIC